MASNSLTEPKFGRGADEQGGKGEISPPLPCSPASLLVIVGPTAVGKTALSLRLAHHFDGEIISADSRQIYRRLDIGTAKPSPAELAQAPHHMIDVVEPDQVLTLAQFQAQAFALVADIHRRQRLPLLVGGTGQWVWAVVEGWGIPRVPPDSVLRAKLEAEVQAVGEAVFHAQLAAVDPAAAAAIDPRNVRRVIRALEVYHKTGIPISEHQRKQPPPYNMVLVGLTRPRPVLYHRVDRRIEQMLAAGLAAEVERLAQAGYGWNLPAMSGLGYRQIGQFVRGEVSLDEAVALIKKETRRFVRQQYNWFSPTDPRIHWFDLGEDESGVDEAVRGLVSLKLGLA